MTVRVFFCNGSSFNWTSGPSVKYRFSKRVKLSSQNTCYPSKRHWWGSNVYTLRAHKCTPLRKASYFWLLEHNKKWPYSNYPVRKSDSSPGSRRLCRANI